MSIEYTIFSTEANPKKRFVLDLYFFFNNSP
jgi:hypothetical protein